MAIGQGTAPAVPHSLVSMPPGLARAHTKTCGQVTRVAGTATLRFRENIPQGYAANNCSFSMEGVEGGKKKTQPHSITILSVSALGLAACLSPGARCVLVSGVVERLLS